MQPQEMIMYQKVRAYRRVKREGEGKASEVKIES